MNDRGRVHRGLSHLHQVGIAHFCQAEVRQRHRQADCGAEMDGLLDLFRPAVLQHQKADDAEGDLFAMHEVMGRLQHGQRVMHPMRRRNAAVLEPQPRQQGVRLDDVLHRLGQAAGASSVIGGQPVAHQRLVTGPCDLLAGDRRRIAVSQPKWHGLRPMLQEHDPALITSDSFRANLAEVARRDIPFDILTFPRHLPPLLDILPEVPTLRGIVDHLSKPDMTVPSLGQWGEDMTRLAAHPNLSCKISGMVTEAGPDWTPARVRPYLSHVAEAFGPDRLVFGTDWPVCTLAATHAQVTDLARNLLGDLFGPEDLAKIFETNAARFYKLPPA